MPDRLPFAAVLFDCDGVLVDSELITNTVLRSLFGEMGWEISQEECIRLFIGRALKDEWRVIREHTGIRIDDDWLAAFRARRDAALRAGLTPIDGAADAVAEIAGDGALLACVTGADRGKVEMQLGVTGLERWFGDRVFSGMESARTKPAPDVYLAAAAALGVDPAGCVVIEDTVAGVTAGVGAGSTVLGFAPGGPVHTPAEALLAAGATAVFASMADLPGLVRAGAG